jgi:nucleotide-binding universal stress UspA family protein
MPDHLFRRVVVPVASVPDATATADALAPYVDPGDTTVVAVHVVEKAGGALDKASVEQREAAAEDAFDALLAGLPGVDVDTATLYGTDVAATVVAATHERDASAIAFTPRGGGRWVTLLTGDVTTGLVEESDVPLVVLPDADGGEQEG